MIVKYKVSDFAKDLNLSAKKVLDELNAMGSTGKKNSSNLEENELNYLLEKFSKDSSVTGSGRVPEQRQGSQGRAQACREEGREEGRKEARGSQGRKEARSSPLPRRLSLPSRTKTK